MRSEESYNYEDDPDYETDIDLYGDDDEIMTPDGPADMLLSELLGTQGDPWGDADI